MKMSLFVSCAVASLVLTLGSGARFAYAQEPPAPATESAPTVGAGDDHQDAGQVGMQGQDQNGDDHQDAGQVGTQGQDQNGDDHPDAGQVGKQGQDQNGDDQIGTPGEDQSGDHQD